MNKIIKISLILIFLLAIPSALFAKCNVTAKGEVNILTNSFPSLEIIGDAFEECESSSLKINHKLSKDHKDELPGALAASSSPYDLIQVSNSTITPLQAAGQLRPLNDLVDKYRDKYNIEDSMLIKFGDDIMAIAFQANAQHLFYRKDLLKKYGIKEPQTYDDVIAAAKKLKKEKSIEHPFSGSFKSGWNLAQEFNNIFLSLGGEFVDPETGKAKFDSSIGRRTLRLMKALQKHMSPNALSLDTTAVMQQFQQGKIAMANLWATRAAKMDDESESKVVGKIEFAAAPASKRGGNSATTIWWDGFSIPKNLDGDADLVFQVMMEGIKESVAADNADAAIWLRSSYTPGRYAKGAVASVQKGAPSYPMTPQMSLIHSAIGNNIGDYLSGKESVRESLKDAVAEYEKAAKDKGYIK